MIQTTVNYAWFATMAAFFLALLNIHKNLEFTFDVILYLPFMMLVLGMLVRVSKSNRVRKAIFSISSLGLIIGVGFTFFASLSSGGQAGVGLALAWLIIGAIYVLLIVLMFAGQEFLR